MAVEAHIDSLKSRHQQLENELRDLMSNTKTDEHAIVDLKRKKLQIKDRIQELTAKMN